MTTPTPGTPTPYAGLPTPAEGATPDVPTDMWRLANALDGLLSNLVGGTTAPTAPLNPGLAAASAAIAGLTSTQSTQGSQIQTLQNQMTSVLPLTSRPYTPELWWETGSQNVSIAGTSSTAQTVNDLTISSGTYPRLTIIYGIVSAFWDDGSSFDGKSYSQLTVTNGPLTRVYDCSYAMGSVASHRVFHVETLASGTTGRYRQNLGVYRPSSYGSGHYLNVNNTAGIYVVTLPWFGDNFAPYLGSWGTP